jgi:hypothetical protein
VPRALVALGLVALSACGESSEPAPDLSSSVDFAVDLGPRCALLEMACSQYGQSVACPELEISCCFCLPDVGGGGRWLCPPNVQSCDFCPSRPVGQSCSAAQIGERFSCGSLCCECLPLPSGGDSWQCSIEQCPSGSFDGGPRD